MQADWVLVNGNIHTLDASRPRVQALAVMGNQVIATGGDADLLAQEATAGKTINLQGRTVVPGFTDSHLHFLSYGLSSTLSKFRDKSRNIARRQSD